MPARLPAAIALTLLVSCADGPELQTGQPPPPATVSEIILRSTRDSFAAAELALANDERTPTRDFSEDNRWRTSVTTKQTTVRVDVEPENLGSTVTVTAQTSSVLGDSKVLETMATETLDRVREILFTGRLENPIPRAYAGPKTSVTRTFSKSVEELFEAAKKSASGIGYRIDKTSTKASNGWWLRGRGPFGLHVDVIRRSDRTHITVTAVEMGTPDPRMTPEKVVEQLGQVAANLLDDIGKRAKDPGQAP